METLIRDVRYAFAMMRHNAGFTFAGLLTLALGIGATTAVFSVVYGVLLRPLPYPEPDRLVRLWEEHPGGTAAAGGRWLSNRTYYAWSEQPRTVDALGAFGTYEYSIGFDEGSTRVFGAEVSPAVLGALGARPIVGRLFVPGEQETGADRVAILSDSFWRQWYQSDPAVLGRSVTLDGRPHAIVGVLSPGFYFPDRRAQFWIPAVIQRVSTDPALSQRTSGFGAIGRLAPGMTPPQAEAEGTAAARSVPVTLSTQLLFGKGGPPVVHVRRLVDDVSVSVRPALLVLAAGVGFVLLIACANVANLFLSRGVVRQREFTVRAAIGGEPGATRAAAPH